MLELVIEDVEQRKRCSHIFYRIIVKMLSSAQSEQNIDMQM